MYEAQVHSGSPCAQAIVLMENLAFVALCVMQSTLSFVTSRFVSAPLRIAPRCSLASQRLVYVNQVKSQ